MKKKDVRPNDENKEMQKFWQVKHKYIIRQAKDEFKEYHVKEVKSKKKI